MSLSKVKLDELADLVAHRLRQRKQELAPEIRSCKTCIFWEPILKEATHMGAGTPARPGWGTCQLRNLDLVRIKGFLETQERFYCVCHKDVR